MAMTELRKEVEAATLAELNRANKNFPLFASEHEGYAVVLEEVEEAQEELDAVQGAMAALWSDIRGKGPKVPPWKIRTLAINAACEMIQVAAMLEKYEMSMKE